MMTNDLGITDARMAVAVLPFLETARNVGLMVERKHSDEAKANYSLRIEGREVGAFQAWFHAKPRPNESYASVYLYEVQDLDKGILHQMKRDDVSFAVSVLPVSETETVTKTVALFRIGMEKIVEGGRLLLEQDHQVSVPRSLVQDLFRQLQRRLEEDLDELESDPVLIRTLPQTMQVLMSEYDGLVALSRSTEVPVLDPQLTARMEAFRTDMSLDRPASVELRP
jgi:hypothetical protein